MSDIVLKTTELTHIYGISTPFERAAIKNVNIEIESGDFIGIIGHTGSGKSTLIQHLNGLIKPTSGKIEFKGQNIWDKNYNISKLRFNVGLVFQYPEYQLFEETVEKDIAFGPKNMGLHDDDIKKRVLSSLEIVGLGTEILNKSPFELSGGQKRRVAIAGIMAMSPSVLILDEPTAGLDPKGRSEILNQIKLYHESEHATVILVSHNMEDVAGYAKKVLVMNNSQVVMYDETKNIFSRADELISMGLDVPQITRVFNELKKRGYNVESSVYTPKEAVRQLIKASGRGNI